MLPNALPFYCRTPERNKFSQRQNQRKRNHHLKRSLSHLSRRKKTTMMMMMTMMRKKRKRKLRMMMMVRLCYFPPLSWITWFSKHILVSLGGWKKYIKRVVAKRSLGSLNFILWITEHADVLLVNETNLKRNHSNSMLAFILVLFLLRIVEVFSMEYIPCKNLLYSETHNQIWGTMCISYSCCYVACSALLSNLIYSSWSYEGKELVQRTFVCNDNFLACYFFVIELHIYN